MPQVEALPGIGRSTAGAILALSFGQRHPILDGNAKRVLARHFGVEGFPGEPKVARRLWALAEGCTPLDRVAHYTQAIMDLGATLCVRSRPHVCHLPGLQYLYCVEEWSAELLADPEDEEAATATYGRRGSGGSQ